MPQSPRRSLLFVPGSEPRRIEKSMDAGADMIIFDLEDSVSPEKKDMARKLVIEALQQNFGQTELAVRINAAGTPFHDEDIALMVQAGCKTLMIPKSHSIESLEKISQLISRFEQNEAATRFLALGW
ncbi:MAG: hypothetical protein HQM12_15305 [SAR324 cluster bacterium]|nr:hypothetical protein [SAR324 cluster bacterium]